MSPYERVPTIDLTPEFVDSPLSATRWQDYFSLLHDLFYFPQRVQAYGSSYARGQRGESSAPRSYSPGAWGEWLRGNPVQVELTIMLIALAGAGLLLLTQGLGAAAAALAGQALPYGAMGLSLVVGLVSALIIVALGVAGGESGALGGFALPAGAALALTVLAFESARLPASGAVGNGLLVILFAAALFWGIASSNLCATAAVSLNGVRLQAIISLILGGALATVAAFGARNDGVGPSGSFLFLLAVAIAGCLAGALRPDDYLLGGGGPGARATVEEWQHIPRVTPIPLAHLHDHLTSWFDSDWKRGLDNASSIWLHTAQQQAVHRALHEVMSPAPASIAPTARSLTASNGKPADAADHRNEWIVEMVARVAADPARYPWEMIAWSGSTRPVFGWQRLRSASSKPGGGEDAALRRRRKRRAQRQRELRQGSPLQLPQDSPEKALAAGFWYLEHGYVDESIAAFARAPASPLTREVQTLLAALNTLSGEETLVTTSAIALPERPKEVRRKESWDALDKVREAARYGRIAHLSVGAERSKRAIDACRRLLDDLTLIPGEECAEVRLLKGMAAAWRAEIESWREGARNRQPLKPVPNPFVFSEPLRRQQGFVGREPELAALRLAWTPGNLQPVLLYGLPQIGKTSLLHTAEALNGHVALAWLNLGNVLGGTATLDQALAAVQSTVRHSSVLELAALQTSRSPANPALPAGPTASPDMLAGTERLVRQVCALIAPRSLILVLDDFDRSLRLFENSQEMVRLLSLLEHLFEAITNFNVAFVSQRAPALFVDRFGRRFAATVSAHAIGALQKGEVARLLRPATLTPYFDDEALETVWRLTAGHPYLVQLIAHGVVQRFNRAALTGAGEPLFVRADIEAVLVDEEFVQRCRVLFAHTLEVVKAEESQTRAQNEASPFASIAQGELWKRWSIAETTSRLPE